MNEQGDQQSSDTSPAVEATGHEAVDEMLRSLDSLAERPVAEHVQVFEAAHETLRAALADAGEAAAARDPR